MMMFKKEIQIKIRVKVKFTLEQATKTPRVVEE